MLAAFKAIQRCELNYLIVVTLTLDSLTEMGKGRIKYAGEARAYDVSRSRARIIGLRRFDGHSSGGKKHELELKIFDEFTEKIAGGEVSANKKTDNGVFLQSLRKSLGILQRH